MSTNPEHLPPPGVPRRHHGLTGMSHGNRADGAGRP